MICNITRSPIQRGCSFFKQQTIVKHCSLKLNFCLQTWCYFNVQLNNINTKSIELDASISTLSCGSEDKSVEIELRFQKKNFLILSFNLTKNAPRKLYIIHSKQNKVGFGLRVVDTRLRNNKIEILKWDEI
ncbi:hypothetical protein BpHYR1_021549 [Brachionus plicatilis]|uniref:Uncharacterized protein n=1 Tax=Brachionus plicatilis TaxID=10195 RepID=A0A3M7SYD1_BRAPC|nr:hypothetical protein BpHYR1_021549 [Brachionus plicatilis]